MQSNFTWNEVGDDQKKNRWKRWQPPNFPGPCGQLKVKNQHNDKWMYWCTVLKSYCSHKPHECEAAKCAGNSHQSSNDNGGNGQMSITTQGFFYPCISEGINNIFFDQFAVDADPCVPNDIARYDRTAPQNEGATMTIGAELTPPSLTFSTIGHDANCMHMRIINDDTPICPSVCIADWMTAN